MEREGEKKEWGKSLPYAFCHLSTSGGAVAVATAVTHPLDVLKVRLQMQLVGQRGPLVGMGEILGKIVKVEGARGLYLGFAPALSRSVVYGGLRLGLYEPCKYLCDLMFGSTNIFVKIASGAFSGALATALTNPMEVLKVRLQMNSGSSPSREMQRILSEEGIRALWKGVGPAMTRASVLTASQLATYDESKQALLRWTHLEEGFHLHLISSCMAGTVSTLVTAPVDMIKTRLMLQKDYGDVGSYRNVFHATYQSIMDHKKMSEVAIRMARKRKTTTGTDSIATSRPAPRMPASSGESRAQGMPPPGAVRRPLQEADVPAKRARGAPSAPQHVEERIYAAEREARLAAAVEELTEHGTPEPAAPQGNP